MPVVAVEEWVEAMGAIVDDAPRSGGLEAAAREALAFVDSVTARRDPAVEAGRALASRIGLPVIETPSIDVAGAADPMSVGQLCGAALAVAAARLSEARRDLAAAREASAVLRREIDKLQSSFLALEGFVQELGLSQTTLALQIDPGGGSLALEGAHGAPSLRLAQRLPISARALVAVDLWCASPPTGEVATARLVVRFEDLGGAVLGAASLPADALAVGWNRVALSVALDCSDRDVVLVLEFEDALSGLALGLGSPTPVARHRVVGVGGTRADSPLAMRLWRGLPGAAAPQHVGSGRGRSARPSDLPRPRTLRRPDEEMGFDPVQYWARENAVLVHPPARGVTYGVIERAPLGAARRVSAVVNNAHAEGPPLRFAIGVAPAGCGGMVDPAAILGTWINLPARAWGEVHAVVEAPPGESVDLILAAMVGEGDSNRFAWALFRSFQACSIDL